MIRICIIAVLLVGCDRPEFVTKHNVYVYYDPCPQDPDFEYPGQAELERAFDYFIDKAPGALRLPWQSVSIAVWNSVLILRCDSWPIGDGRRRAGYRVGDTVWYHWYNLWDFCLFHEYAHIAREEAIGNSDSDHKDQLFWDAVKALGKRYIGV
jgi:hypothetical protein